MKTVKFEIELKEGSFKTYTEEEYAEYARLAADVYEDPAEYLGHVLMFQTTLDGKTVWVGVN